MTITLVGLTLLAPPFRLTALTPGGSVAGPFFRVSSQAFAFGSVAFDALGDRTITSQSFTCGATNSDGLALGPAASQAYTPGSIRSQGK